MSTLDTFSNARPTYLVDGMTGAPAPSGSSTSPMYVSNPALTAGANASGTATTSASVLAAANAARTFLVGQNIGANNIWINEVGGTAAANTAGSYKVIPGGAFSISTNRAISVIAETGSTAYTATEG